MGPFIKWPGGKTAELDVIHAALPETFERYFEPFAGGGAVYWSLSDGHEFFLNDKSEELIALYNAVRVQDEELYAALKKTDDGWKTCRDVCLRFSDEAAALYALAAGPDGADDAARQRIEEFLKRNIFPALGQVCEAFQISSERMDKEVRLALVRKIKSVRKIEQQQGKLSAEDIVMCFETGIKSGIYTCLRDAYNTQKERLNKSQLSALFYFIREYCYSSMFRYNKSGGFNVPYGGSSYNNKSIYEKICAAKSPQAVERLKATSFFCLDFEDFLTQTAPGKNDLVFLDPPYDTSFSTYAQNAFSEQDHRRLAALCGALDARFMLVIKDTPFIRGLYSDFHISLFDKTYLVSFKNRNQKSAKHLVITNY